jgi:hypothetical protein
MEFKLPYSPVNQSPDKQRSYKPHFIYYGKRFIIKDKPKTVKKSKKKRN